MKHQKKTTVTVSKMRKQLKKLFRQRTIHRKDMLIQLDSNLDSRTNIQEQFYFPQSSFLRREHWKQDNMILLILSLIIVIPRVHSYFPFISSKVWFRNDWFDYLRGGYCNRASLFLSTRASSWWGSFEENIL